MRRWLALLGGPLIWAVHFVLIYAIASAFELGVGAGAPLSRGLIIVAGIAAGAAAGWLMLRALRAETGADDLDGFLRAIAATGAALSLIAIIWQTLPAVAL